MASFVKRLTLQRGEVLVAREEFHHAYKLSTVKLTLETGVMQN